MDKQQHQAYDVYAQHTDNSRYHFLSGFAGLPSSAITTRVKLSPTTKTALAFYIKAGRTSLTISWYSKHQMEHGIIIGHVPTARRRSRALRPLFAKVSSFVPNSALPLAIFNQFAGFQRPLPDILTSPFGWHGS
jgi:hypothetical protein